MWGNQEEENKGTQDTGNSQSGSSATQNNDELVAAHERLKQQYAGSTQEAERLKALYGKTVDREIEKVAWDNAYLLELSDKDPDLAREVAKKGWNLPLEQAIMKVNELNTSGSKEKKKDENPLDEETLYKKFYERIKNELSTESAHKQAFELFGHLQGTEKEAAETLYKELTAGRNNLTLEEAQKYAEMATLYTKKDQIASGKGDFNIAMFASTGSLGRTATSTQTNQDNQNSGEELAKSLGLWSLYSKK